MQRENREMLKSALYQTRALFSLQHLGQKSVGHCCNFSL